MLTHWRTWPGREQSCYFCPQPRPRMGPVWTPIWACGSGGAGRGARSHSILVAAPLGLPPPLCLKSLLHAILSAGRKWGFKRCGENVLSHDLSKTFNSKRDFPLGCISCIVQQSSLKVSFFNSMTFWHNASWRMIFQLKCEPTFWHFPFCHFAQ